MAVDMNPLIGAIIALLIVALVVGSFIVFRANAKALPVVIVGIAVATVILCVFVPVMTGSESKPFDYDNIRYDDYFENSDIDSVSGALEIVTVGDSRYIHADAVGDAAITFSDGSIRNVTVKKADLHVFMFIGQSNAAYWSGVDPTKEKPIPHLGSSYYYGTASAQSNKNLGEVTYDFHEMVDPSTGAAVIGGIDAPFAATLYNELGWKSMIVNCAVGGSSITTWVPAAENYVYAQGLFDDAWDSIDTDLFSPVIESYIWIQGEANASTGVATYETYYLQMHNALIDGSFTTHGAFKDALISKVREQNAPNPSIAQLLLASEYSTIFVGCQLADSFTVANGLMLSDNLHYSQLGRNLIGEALGKYFADNMI